MGITISSFSFWVTTNKLNKVRYTYILQLLLLLVLLLQSLFHIDIHFDIQFHIEILI